MASDLGGFLDGEGAHADGDLDTTGSVDHGGLGSISVRDLFRMR
jgi:hypothetical protein